jgi:uroporphyrinogen-III synthase
MPLAALITRPEEDARPLAEALADRGIATLIEPLLAIRPLPEAAADLEKDLAGVQALLFTSANGARAFAELSRRRDIGVLAVGDATASAARALGFTAVESAGGDVQSLARLAKQRLKPAAGPLFHAAGSAVAGDLAGILAAEGFELRRRVLYESATATALSPETLAALKQGRVDLVLLFSPRTAATFAELAKDIQGSLPIALCLSPAVAAAVQGLSWRRVEIADKPDLPSLLALVDRVKEAAEAETRPAPLGAPQPALVTRRRPEPASVPATPVPTLVPAPRRSGASVFLAGLIGALLAAAAVVAVIHYAPQKLGLVRVGAQPAGAADLTPRLADLSRRLQAQQKQIESLPKGSPDLGDLPAKLAALQQQVAALPSPSAPAALPAEIANLPQKLAALDQRLSALEQKLAALPQGGVSAADLAPLKSELDSLNQTLQHHEAALADLKQDMAKRAATDASASTAKIAAGLVLGALELRAHIAAGEPFAAELAAMEKLAAADPALSQPLAEPLAALKPFAIAGTPSLARLQAEFPPISVAVVHADATQALPPNASFWDRIVARLESLVTIRPVGEGSEATGNSNIAHLARGEDQLARGNLPAAVDELSAMTGPAHDAAAAWIAEAKARFQLNEASRKLSEALLGVLAGGAH